ncbi:conserved membrane protein [Candidatus Protochlamydia naegleriophila]|uniref:Conserved membrane protein n=1 Tax=Candidatus Protochlamydia naegleriophila TaxID=389348 RepID=A0A0U5JIA5_9BACT|nr:hypothetical protein [Candidatus Protochlamydia naegleriophila]CUI17717.1 conserved membrane protein [Candidatus Protochlamydia naegleriophila]
MVCPVCPTAGFFGGLIGGYLGIHPPATFRGRCISGLATAGLVSATIVALKTIFKISLCYGTGFTLANVSVVLAKTLAMGIVYSIGVNFLLNRFIFIERTQTQTQPIQPASQECPHCCHH